MYISDIDRYIIIDTQRDCMLLLVYSRVCKTGYHLLSYYYLYLLLLVATTLYVRIMLKDPLPLFMCGIAFVTCRVIIKYYINYDNDIVLLND